MSSATSSTPSTASSSIHNLPVLKDEALPLISLQSSAGTWLNDGKSSIISVPSSTGLTNEEKVINGMIGFAAYDGWRLTTHPRAQHNYIERLTRIGPPTRSFFQKLRAEAGRHVMVCISPSCDGPQLYLAPSLIEGAGIGLFTSGAIKKSNSPLLYYTGELLSEAEARERYSLKSGRKFAEVDSEYLAELSGVFIDASNPYCSGAARYINHQASGLANCSMNQYGGIIPIKNIPAYSELYYTYHGRWQAFLSSSSVSPDATNQPPRMLNGRCQ